MVLLQILKLHKKCCGCLWEWLESEEFLQKEFDYVADKLDLTRADIPNDLQQFWIDNQERLQLTGKYLPDNSNLLQYKK